jgi:F-type H+-transporting ATPase subunit delta
MQTTRKDRRKAAQLFRLCVVKGQVDEGRVRAVARALGGSRRRGGVGTLSHFQRLVRLELERRRALVESAAPLDEGLREAILDGLARTYGPGLETTFAHDPRLIAGMRIRVGSEVYDDSVRARLAVLEGRLSHG